MCMADRNGKRIGGIRLAAVAPRQQAAHHQLHLRLLGVTGADHCLFDKVRRIFGDRKPAFGRGKQHHPASNAEPQGRRRIAVDKSFFDRGLVRAKALDNGSDLPEQRNEPRRQRLIGGGMNDAVGNVGQAVAGHIDNPPPGMTQPGIEP